MISSQSLDKLEFGKVLGFISNYAVTEKGKEQILSLQPSSDLNSVVKENELVQEAKNILISLQSPPMEFLPDLSKSLNQSRVEGSVLDSKKILEILKLAETSRNIIQYLKANSASTEKLYEISKNLFVDKVFEHHIKKVIKETGEINDNASPELKKIRNELIDKKEELVKSINRIVKKLSEKDVVREDYLTLRDGRMVIPVKAEHKRHLRGFIHSESATGHTVYVEPEETLELNNEIVSLSFAERREIEKLLRELTRLIGNYADDLINSFNTIIYIDSLFARARYSIEIIGSFPGINKSRIFSIKNGRHPILLKKFGRDKTIPLNLEIKENKVIIITGPNAGGKTVVLKTAGLLCALFQAGIHIPVSPDSDFKVFKNILLDIGDEQSIEDDLSTFSSHLGNIRNILSSADNDSLVLLDEIGTGTDPSEGSAIATAVLLELKEKGAYTLASTHHGNLKIFADQTEGIENAAMEFDHDKLTPNYIFKQGIPGSSYAFEVAKRIGFNDKFLNAAKQNLDTDRHKLENFLADIEKKSNILAENLKNIEIENTRLAGLTELYKNKIDKLEKEKSEIIKKAKQEADNYLQDINKQIEKIIKELRESGAKKEVIKESQKIVKELKEKNKNLFSQDIELDSEKTHFTIGNFVRLKNTQTFGEIVEIDYNKASAGLRVGAIKMLVKLENLIPALKTEARESTTSRIEYQVHIPAYRLDIRGEKPEEAEFEVIKFIDDAYTSGLDRIEILHGKGTGVLKKMVWDILKKHDKVKAFNYAPVEIGGEGITIIELN
jgi:DNA mismatch repair protein MutS2